MSKVCCYAISGCLYRIIPCRSIRTVLPLIAQVLSCCRYTKYCLLSHKHTLIFRLACDFQSLAYGQFGYLGCYTVCPVAYYTAESHSVMTKVCCYAVSGCLYRIIPCRSIRTVLPLIAQVLSCCRYTKYCLLSHKHTLIFRLACDFQSLAYGQFGYLGCYTVCPITYYTAETHPIMAKVRRYAVSSCLYGIVPCRSIRAVLPLVTQVLSCRCYTEYCLLSYKYALILRLACDFQNTLRLCSENNIINIKYTIKYQC